MEEEIIKFATSESALRLEDPSKYSQYKRTQGGTIYGSLRIPKIISIIWGHTLGEPLDAWHPQALRFPTKYWKDQDARDWVRHNIKNYISYDPATIQKTK